MDGPSIMNDLSNAIEYLTMIVDTDKVETPSYLRFHALLGIQKSRHCDEWRSTVCSMNVGPGLVVETHQTQGHGVGVVVGVHRMEGVAERQVDPHDVVCRVVGAGEEADAVAVEVRTAGAVGATTEAAACCCRRVRCCAANLKA